MVCSWEARYSPRRYETGSSTGPGTTLLMIRSSLKSCRAIALASTQSITIKMMKRTLTKRMGQIRTYSTG